jgi:hypothetical protein
MLMSARVSVKTVGETKNPRSPTRSPPVRTEAPSARPAST